ncbi:hypothetical protein FSP39_019282 [Pinctada imbricata]|uniref:C2H2-type domain-containing protein n=1 Tax=Pinctada imbricata TaxID=66713 RepID=A0AA88XS44_PINIB|nr:hypothetical protein FSP39_019282 [Pinctada imbricata]
MYICFYCNLTFEVLEDIVDHAVKYHNKYELKYGIKILDEKEGKLFYQTKIHDKIIPNELSKSNRCIRVQGGHIYISDSGAKHKKLNTPTETCKIFDFKHEEDQEPMSEDAKVIHEAYLRELGSMLPKVIEALETEGQLETYLKFNRLLAAGDFPMTNICYLLFLDLVEWFSCPTTTLMRYRSETLKFWQIGYKLFHGKFLRFMTGLKNEGEILNHDTEKGFFDPLRSKINFPVPSKHALYKTNEKPSPFFPGISDKCIEIMAKHYLQKPLKLSVDGKKISRGKCKEMGDIDCWGFENSPTLSRRKSEHSDDLLSIGTFIESIFNIEEKGVYFLDEVGIGDKASLLTNLRHLVQRLGSRNSDLREKDLHLERLEEKFKRLGGPQWKVSKFYPVISSIRVNRSEVRNQIQESLRLSDDLSFFGSIVNDCGQIFSKSQSVDLSSQKNYIELKENNKTNDTRFIKQRTESGCL